MQRRKKNCLSDAGLAHGVYLHPPQPSQPGCTKLAPTMSMLWLRVSTRSGRVARSTRRALRNRALALSAMSVTADTTTTTKSSCGDAQGRVGANGRAHVELKHTGAACLSQSLMPKEGCVGGLHPRASSASCTPPCCC